VVPENTVVIANPKGRARMMPLFQRQQEAAE
jgi:hypothetical protein